MFFMGQSTNSMAMASVASPVSLPESSHSWMACNRKSQSQMDDEMGYPYDSGNLHMVLMLEQHTEELWKRLNSSTQSYHEFDQMQVSIVMGYPHSWMV